MFKIGLTITDIKTSGTMPVASEKLIATVIARKIESRMVHKCGTGMGSGGEEFGSLVFSREHTAFSTAG